MKVTKNIDIYLTNKRPVKTIDVVQGDTGIQLVFTLKDFTIPSGSKATLYVQKPSGKFVYQNENITVLANTITIDLENQALTEYGEIPYQVSIENGADTVTTFTGIMIVQPSLKDSGAIKSGTVVRAFDELTVEKLAEFQERAETAATGVIATIPEDYTKVTAKVNQLANAIKGNLSGEVVAADDVSPVEHEMVVKVVCPDGIEPTTVNVRRCGKNLFDITNFIGKVNTVNGVTAQVMEDGCVHVSGSPIDTSVSTTIDLSHNKDTQKFPKGTYVYSNNAIRANENILCFPQANNSITGSWLANFLPTGGEISTEFSIRHIVVFIKQGVTGDVSSKFYLQVESGNNATEFEPFKDISTHTPSSDGTVSGMTSLSPNMTILTDTDGVTIECEYNKDTNKVIQKLVNAITAMGGEVTI